MSRSVNSVASRNRRRRILKQTKGYFGRRKNVLTVAKNALQRSKMYRYRDLRQKKRDIKSIWIQRINAAARLLGLNYSSFVNNLKNAGVEIKRKVLADLAMNNFDEFKKLINNK